MCSIVFHLPYPLSRQFASLSQGESPSRRRIAFLELYVPLNEELSRRLDLEAHGHLDDVPLEEESFFLFPTIKDAVDVCGRSFLACKISYF